MPTRIESALEPQNSKPYNSDEVNEVSDVRTSAAARAARSDG